MNLPLNADGSLREYTKEEIAAFELQSRDVRDGSHPTFVRSMNTSTVRVKYFCNPDKLDDVICYFLGAVTTYDNGGVRAISRLMPRTWPGQSNVAFTQLVSAKGFKFIEDDPDIDAYPIPTHDKAEVEFMAEVVPFELYSDEELADHGQSEYYRYFQRMPSQGDAQYITLPGSTMKYTVSGGGAPHNVAVPMNIGYIMPTTIISRKWHRIPRYEGWTEGSTLWNRFYGDYEAGTKPYIGTINKTTLFGFPPGTMLLMAPEDEIVFDPVTQEFVTNLVMKWQHKPQGHNWLPYFPPAAGAGLGFYYVSTDSVYRTNSELASLDGKSLFNVREHKDLFKVGVV